MPQSTPKAAILLEAAVKYLESELMPTLDGYHRFQTRVTVNVLNTCAANWNSAARRLKQSARGWSRCSATTARSRR